MLKTYFTKQNIIFTVSILMLFGLIGFVEKKTSEKVVNNVIINIKDEHGHYFVDENDINKIITSSYSDSIRGKGYEDINLKTMEKQIKANKFVEKGGRNSMVMKYFYPKRLRSLLIQEAQKSNYMLNYRKGRASRKWEKDRPKDRKVIEKLNKRVVKKKQIKIA